MEAQGSSTLTNGNELCDLIFDRGPPVPREETTPFSQGGKAIWRLFFPPDEGVAVYRWLDDITSANTRLMVVCCSGG